MTRARGFTLVEALVACTIMLVVLGALTAAVGSFFDGQRRVAARRDALMIAAAEISIYERPGASLEPGGDTRTQVLPGGTYTVRTQVVEEEPCVRRLEVSVFSTESGEVDLVREFYVPEGGV